MVGPLNLYDDPTTMLPRPSPSPAAAPRLVIERLSDRLATLLAAQVESGSLSPGDRLPTEQQLAQAHGVSRTVVREAVHQLTSRGLLISRQGSGVYVSKAPR
ncbi:MAG: winged helix-turn-helix domain-containing protein, partial [Microvirga sp.]